MKKTVKKLVLSRESIARLDMSDLHRGVVGAATAAQTNCQLCGVTAIVNCTGNTQNCSKTSCLC
jgi:hypothetical protein